MPATRVLVRRKAALLAAPALAALLGLAACSSGSSATSVSSTTPLTSPTSSPATSSASGSATDSTGGAASSASSLASSASSQAAAIAQCLQNAGLPTPTSSDVTGSAAEIAKLVTDPKTADALRKCGVSLPGLASASS